MRDASGGSVWPKEIIDVRNDAALGVTNGAGLAIVGCNKEHPP